MGLPLFVAPVESDLPSKAAAKGRATSPSRSGIRRNRPDSRERRANIRRAATLREHQRAAAERFSQIQSTVAAGLEGHPIPWIESGFPPVTMGADGSLSTIATIRGRDRPFRQVLREMAGTGDQRQGEDQPESDHDVYYLTAPPGPLMEQVATLTEALERPNEWRRVSPQPTPRAQTQQSEEDLETARRRAAIYEAMFDTDPNESAADSAFRRRRREIDGRTPWQSSNANYSNREAPPTGRRAPTRESRLRALSRRRPATSRSREINGLGDRERSLSPEVWDTLLTTLTPDPQPPSAGSSFASTVAPQGTGVSSSTSLTEPAMADGNAVDPACDSGGENSDHEDHDDDDDDHPEVTVVRTRERRDDSRHVRLRVPFVPRDAPVDGPAEGPSTTSPFHHIDVSMPVNTTDSMTAAATASGSQPSTDWTETRRRAEEALERQVEEEYSDPRYFVGSGWVARLSVGASDDEQASAERRNLNRDNSTASGNNPSQGEEDWLGMRRIVRSLALREDIPDEWWAEAGLSRTLPRDSTD